MSLSIYQRISTALVFAFMSIAASSQLPYNPTFAFVSPSTSLVFILKPSNDGLTYQLSSVNTSTQLSTTDLSTTTLLGSLPFQLSPQTALSATLDSQNSFYLLSGACHDGAQGIGLWTYNATGFTNTGGGWMHKSLETDGIEDPKSNGGLNFLGSVIAFSGAGMTNPELYSFGGLCPNSTSLIAETWQSSASYSNNMLLFQASSGGGPEQYAINNVVSRGPPIPEAGFSVSPLDAAYLNSSETSVVSQQNFAFVGGQTSTAFINMSQVALFSLPEQTWSFLPVSDPDSSATSNPSRRASATLDPRSGHAAAISDDGRRIWIVGGWVGDVSTPADPQLLVLEVGGSYGGTGNWQWTIPSQETGGPAGLYGHAAVMLPGDILMITGGYDISNVNSKLLRRRTGPPASTNTYFYNTSSNMWISNYQNPNANSNTSSGSFSPSDQTSGKTIGLGVGLGLGLPFLIVGLLYVLYRRRLRKRRQRRDRALQIPINPPAYQSRIPGSGGIDRQNDIPDQQAMQERSTANPYPWAPAPATAGSLGVGRGSEAERTGLLYDIPSPTRGLRRSLHSRSNNHWYEDGRRSRGSGHIHPINEEDEGDPSSGGRNARSGQTLIPLSDDIVSAAPVLDPFQDSRDRHLLDGSRSPSPVSPAQEREQEFQGWMNDWTVAQYRRQQQAGRTSPDKSDRTSSSLSDSARSAISALSYQPSVKRSSSQRSAALLSANVLPSPQRISPPESPQSPTAPAQYRRSHSLTLGQRSRIEESEPSGPSFPRLQAEGQALLGRAPPQPDSPTRTESRARTWMGSVRRALTGSQRNSIVTPEGRSSLGSEPGMLQRSASAGSMPWRRRQGARDWDYDDPSPEPGPTSTHGPDEDDWDVESAVERRVVQVMFTVPKDRLRVVNAGPGGDGASIASVEQDPLIDASQEKNKAKAKDEHEGQGVD